VSFINTVLSALRTIPRLAADNRELRREIQRLRHALGRVEARQTAAQAQDLPVRAYEFGATSQWGEDGIIQHLLRHVPIAQRVFVEFGVEDYTESNTRFLLQHDNWSGLVIDGSAENIRRIERSELYWRHRLKALHAFITRENINELLRAGGASGEIGILSVDIDGNDYWVWEAIDAVNAAIVILEYNGRFLPDQSVTVPYDPSFQRGQAHHSHIYYGASLAALTALSAKKGYALVGSNSAGSNAFYVRRDLLRAPLREVSVTEAWIRPQFRECRDSAGKLTFASTEEEDRILASLPLVQV
jgi:hypothetical protein